MSTHTPGPWRVEIIPGIADVYPVSVVADGPRFICDFPRLRTEVIA